MRAPPLCAPAPLSRPCVGARRVAEGSDGPVAHALDEPLTRPVSVEPTSERRGPVDLTNFIVLARRMSIPTDEAIRQFVGVNVLRRGGRGDPDGDLTLEGRDAERPSRLGASSRDRTRGHGADGRAPGTTESVSRAR